MMRAIVTGGAGFIGSHLVDHLVDDGLDVTVVDNLTTGQHIHETAKTVAVSVRNFVPEPADVIFHLASPVGPVGVLSQAGRIAADVVADAVTVAAWARAYDAPLVYVSTSELYGPQTGACAESLPRVTPAGHSARMEYAVAKLAAETMLLNTPGLDVRIVRPFNVAGPRQRPEGGFVLPRFIAQALAHEPLTVYTPGNQLRAFTHVLDIVDGLIAVAARGHAGDVFNLGNAANLTTIGDLAERVLELVWPEGEIALVDPHALWGPAFREAADKYPDASFAAQRLSWRAYRPLSQVIRDTAASHGLVPC